MIHPGAHMHVSLSSSLSLPVMGDVEHVVQELLPGGVYCCCAGVFFLQEHKINMATKKLPQFKLRSLQETTGQGFRVRLLGSNGPELVFTDGTVVVVSHNLGVHQLVWRLTGCCRGQYHYRVCTSKTIQYASDLWCPFCKYDEDAWRQEGKRLPPVCELTFMELLRACNIDTDFSCQVVPPFWHAPMDFCHLHLGYFVQIDGRCHWVGIHQLTAAMIIERDMQQNMAVIQAGACMVPVHEHDLSNGACVAAALDAATLGCCIVLTSAYTTTLVSSGPCVLPYLQLLLLLCPNCCYDTDAYGDSRLWKM